MELAVALLSEASTESSSRSYQECMKDVSLIILEFYT